MSDPRVLCLLVPLRKIYEKYKNIKIDEMDGHDVAELVLALEVTAEVQSWNTQFLKAERSPAPSLLAVTIENDFTISDCFTL